MEDVIDTNEQEQSSLQRLRARVARRPGRWRRRMARSRTSPSPSTGWAARSREDQRQSRLELDAA